MRKFQVTRPNLASPTHTRMQNGVTQTWTGTYNMHVTWTDTRSARKVRAFKPSWTRTRKAYWSETRSYSQTRDHVTEIYTIVVWGG